MILEAGEKQTRAYLQRMSNKRDEYGDKRRDLYVDVGSRLGKLSAVTPKNLDIAKGFAATVVADFKCDHWADIDGNCRLVIHGATYAVSGVIHDPLPCPQWTQVWLSKVSN